MLNKIIGNKIRLCRQQENMTQEKLADILYTSHQLISKWENGGSIPDITNLFALAEIFNVSIDFLCGIEEKDQYIDNIINKSSFNKAMTFQQFKEQNKTLANEIKKFPLNEHLLLHQLRLLRQMHDRSETDDEIKYCNELIKVCAERIIDVSLNEGYISLANYNLAVVYQEKEPTTENLSKSREYADKVYYKDMHHRMYPTFGVDFRSHKFLSISNQHIYKLMLDIEKMAQNTLHISKQIELPNTEVNELKVFHQDISELVNRWKNIMHSK